jgi:hypothetical protein
MFLTKFDGVTGNILYSTYIGGSGVDRADSIATDSNGNAYVVGRVDSTSNDFPATPGSFGPAYRGGDFDGVVFKLNPQGNGLIYSGFLGGEENDSLKESQSMLTTSLRHWRHQVEFVSHQRRYLPGFAGRRHRRVSDKNQRERIRLYSTQLLSAAPELIAAAELS